MSNQQNAKPAFVGAVALLVAGAGAGFFLMVGANEPAQAEKSVQVVAAPRAQPAQMPTPVAQPIEPGDEPVAVDPPSTAREAPSKASRLARDLEREQIWTALGREHNLKPAGPGSAAPSESEAAKLPELKPEYVREAIREQLMPIALECYNTALRQDPELAGQITVKFTIVGEEEIGGVVESAEIDGEETTLDSEFLGECMRESVMAVTFDPPPNSGRVDVTYPFMFEPG